MYIWPSPDVFASSYFCDFRAITTFVRPPVPVYSLTTPSLYRTGIRAMLSASVREYAFQAVDSIAGPGVELANH